jgi:hypothetical protein
MDKHYEWQLESLKARHEYYRENRKRCPCCASEFVVNTGPYESDSEMECGAVFCSSGIWVSKCNKAGQLVEDWLMKKGIANSPPPFYDAQLAKRYKREDSGAYVFVALVMFIVIGYIFG